MLFLRFLFREIAGWLLVGLGLYVFYLCFRLLVNNPPYIATSFPLMIIGIFIFRGGIHLLKVAVAARICLSVRRDEPIKVNREIPFTRL